MDVDEEDTDPRSSATQPGDLPQCKAVVLDEDSETLGNSTIY